jgi:hypothetical protein
MNPLLRKIAKQPATTTSFFETDGYLYHGTTTTDLQSILKDGKVDGISFWGVKDMADMYEGGAMFRVPVSRFNQAFLLPDENMINDPYFIEDENGDYDPKKMKAVNRAWKASKKTWEDSLQIWGAVMYDEDLPVTQADVVGDSCKTRGHK